jgi:hypothetical protein
MYLSAERLAVANQAVRDTFEQTSIAWQAIPHWETGDPGQFRVRSDSAHATEVEGDGLAHPLGGVSLELKAESVRFELRVAQAIAVPPGQPYPTTPPRATTTAADAPGQSFPFAPPWAMTTGGPSQPTSLASTSQTLEIVRPRDPNVAFFRAPSEGGSLHHLSHLPSEPAVEHQPASSFPRFAESAASAAPIQTAEQSRYRFGQGQEAAAVPRDKPEELELVKPLKDPTR